MESQRLCQELSQVQKPDAHLRIELAYRAKPSRPVTQKTDRVDRAENRDAFLPTICCQISASAPLLPCVRNERMRSCGQDGAGAGILG